MYTVLLTLTETPYQLIPVIALICNIVVVSGYCIQYIRYHSFSFIKTIPFILFSVPAAYLGGQLIIQQGTLYVLLGISLLCAGGILVYQGFIKTRVPFYTAVKRPTRLMVSIGLGAAIGYLSGMVGIGGGIFLSPILHMLSDVSERDIASISSVYILVNSVSGLTGQLVKLNGLTLTTHINDYIPLITIVILGSIIGNKMSFRYFNRRYIKVITGLIITVAGARIVFL